jgi:hypothetical protein
MKLLRAIASLVPGSRPRGISVGPCFTCDAMRKPFVVDAPAPMLKKHAQLTKHARTLYMTLRALADGVTGELRINGRWLKATVFDRAAEMCRDIRMRSMRELIALGLVTLERRRVWRVLGGRMRSVLGEARYTVHREPVPKNHQKANKSSKVDLLKSIPSTVEEIDSQYLSNPPLGAGSVLVCSSKVLAEQRNHPHQSTAVKDEDDCSSTVNENSKPKSQTKPSVEEPKLPPALRSWMNTRILARGRDVRCPSSYLKVSAPAFLESLNDEIEIFLTERAQEFMRQKIDANSIIGFDDVYDFLHAESEKHAFDLDGFDVDTLDFLGRVYDSASDILGLSDVDENDVLVSCPNCKAKVLQSHLAAHVETHGGPRGVDERYAHLVKPEFRT